MEPEVSGALAHWYREVLQLNLKTTTTKTNKKQNKTKQNKNK